jgi:uncharacterized repeat protein (TIGR01451 family)/MYXO-CTERM domain-containing protein
MHAPNAFPARPGLAALAASLALVSTPALADDFAAGSYIVPMDLGNQDEGMLRAYGLVYELLRNGVPVRWVIKTGKNFGEPDFVVGGVPYLAGPWVIDSVDAAAAQPIIDAWVVQYPEVNVHLAPEPFSGDVARYLVVAPTIAMVADGNQDIARDYMLAAGIPDSTLDPAWPNDSPDMLDVDELMGPTDASHTDGALFDEDGDPTYCQLMSMHWGVNDAEANPEVVAEVRAYLNNPVHFFAECQAVNAFENLEPHGFFLTPNGFEIGPRPDEVDFYNADSPFGQIDGGYETIGGSEPSYSLPPGDMYLAGDIVMLTGAGTPEGVEDVWMTGFLDGQCPPDQHECGPYGKISYLGGHAYSTNTPISTNLDTQGARMFLNSLFEAPCATVFGLPTIAIAVAAPLQTETPDVTFKVTYVNTSFATALDVEMRDTLPPGATFVSASAGGMLDGSDVVWSLGNLGPGESGDLEIEVHLENFGLYDNGAALSYRVGLNPFVLPSNVSQTEYGEDFGGDSTSGGADGTGTADGGVASGDDDGAATTGAMTSGGASTSGGDTDGSSAGGAGDGSDSGCGCTSGPREGGGGPLALLALLGLVGVRRRRLAAAVLLAAGCSPASATNGDDGSGGIGDDDGVPSSGPGGDETGMKLDVAPATDTPFQTSGCTKIDFLFVIDSSESMKNHQEDLVASFPGFATSIEEAVLTNDWHVMVVDTDAQWSGAECQNACLTLGTCPDAPAFPCDTSPPTLCDISIGSGEVAPFGEGASNLSCIGGASRFVDGTVVADLSETFSCVAQVGVDGNSEERTAEAMVRSISADLLAEGGCNHGFLRDDAILVVTIITDEPDDASLDEPAQWASALVAAKGGDEAAIVVLGLIPDGDAPMTLCAEPVAAPRLGALLAEFPNSSRASVCEPDYSPFFSDAVQVIAQTCQDFVPPG